MSQFTIKLSDKADALIAQLQKEIFNRRRKKVSPAGVVETLVESGAKSQSDKRFATSWTNLIADIEKAAKAANAHGSKPANLSDAEWALILSHRSRAASTATPKAGAKATKTTRAAKAKPATQATKAVKSASPRKAAVKTAAAKPAAKAAKPAAKAAVKTTAKSATKPAAKRSTAKAQPAAAVRNPIRKSAASGTSVKPAAARKVAAKAKSGTSSVARRMAKAVSRLSASAAGAALAPTTPSSNGAVVLVGSP
ncbi:MAG: hypothetical protein ACKO5M_05215 [Vulcanococcus sp.]